MIRRSFQVGLTLGLLAGLAAAVVKMLGSRGEREPALGTVATDPWPRLQPDPTPVPQPASPPVAQVAPVAPAPAPPAPAPAPAKPVAKAKAPAKKKAPAAAWVEPKGAVCPTSHPVKGKLASKIFHLPGMLNYERTNPDRCYRDATAAESDGLRAAKR